MTASNGSDQAIEEAHNLPEQEDDAVDVLLIEDDPAVVEMYQLKLSLDGYRVSIAADGESGIEQALELRPDIIFLDIRLPKKDGFAVLQELREHDETREVPVIILSNYGERDLVERGLKLGALEYVIKADTTPSSLSGGIGRWVEQQQSEMPTAG